MKHETSAKQGGSLGRGLEECDALEKIRTGVRVFKREVRELLSG